MESTSKELSSSESPGSDDDFSFCDKKHQPFTYHNEIENLELTDGEKNKLRKLFKKVADSFTLSKSQIEKINKFDINDVSDLKCKYTMGRGLCRPDINEQPINTHGFTREETDIIEDNYDRFCEKYGFHVRQDVNIFLPSSFARRNGTDTLSIEQLRVFCCYLSQNLYNRPPRSVYAKFVKIYYCYRSGPFSPEEDELLKSWYDLNPGKCIYSILGRLLHRSRNLVRRRVLRLLGDAKKKRRTAETPSYVEDILNCESDVYPDWTKNEKAWKKITTLKDQDVKDLKKTYFREIYPSVRASKKVTSREFKLTLLELLCSLKDPTWSNVDWVQLGKKCYNVGAVRAYSVIRMLTKKYVPKKYWDDLAVAIRIIKEGHTALRDYAKKYFVSMKKENDISNSENDSPKMIRRKLMSMRNGVQNQKARLRRQGQSSLSQDDSETDGFDAPSVVPRRSFRNKSLQKQSGKHEEECKDEVNENTCDGSD